MQNPPVSRSDTNGSNATEVRLARRRALQIAQEGKPQHCGLKEQTCRGPPSQNPFRFAPRSVLASTLNAIAQARVTLPLRQGHLRAVCGPRQEERGLNSAVLKMMHSRRAGGRQRAPEALHQAVLPADGASPSLE